MIVRMGLFAAILSALVYFFNQFTGAAGSSNTTSEQVDLADFNFLPSSTTGTLIYNPYFALSYSETHKQAEWVAYKLTAERLNMPWVRRADAFLPDARLKDKSATPQDYRGSGYDRGHLVPAADMAFSEEAMAQTFLMSNISPQARLFNKGIWRELEELVRDWARKNGELYVVSGPILTEKPKGRIGTSQVSVPTAYYKVILDYKDPQRKGIGFIIPNEVSYEPLFKYAVPISEVERRTGIDFFPKLLSKSESRELKGTFNIDLWDFSKKKYELRTQKWNIEGNTEE